MKRALAWGPPALAALAAALLHWRALTAPFFADDWLFLDQARLKPLLAAAFSPDPIGNFFRPLGRVLWFWTLGRLGGESPGAFHAANLLLWLASVVLLWRLAGRLAGPRAAAVAAGVFALTYAADVPVLWASGAQDLLALALALAALLAAAHGRIALAAVALFLAPFAKETVAVALVPALLLARRPGDAPAAWARRAWPLAAASLAWGALAALALARRASPESALALSPWGPLAAVANLARVALGLEWRAGGFPWAPPALPGGAALAAIALAGLGVALVESARGRPGAPTPATKPGRKKGPAAPAPAAARAEPPAPRSAWLAAAAWALAGAAPVALVAPIWSAYYYLFAMGGVALLAGLAAARAPAGAAAAIVLVAGFGAHQARALDEFATAPSPWSAQSHVSRFYLERGMAVAERCVADLRAARPAVPAGSTFFLSGVPAFAAVQVADGPLVRGVYRDTTLRSYYGSRFRRAALGRGEVFVFIWDAAERRLADRTDEPDLWLSLGIGHLLNEHPETAAEAFELALEKEGDRPMPRYGAAVARAASGDSAAARRHLAALRFGFARDAGGAGEQAGRALAAGDTAAAVRLASAASAAAVFDPAPHLVLSRAYAGRPDTRGLAVLEAFAAVAFAPAHAGSWRNWAAVQRQLGYHPEAFGSLERYFELDPAARAADEEAVGWQAELRERLPGGLAAQRSMKDDLEGAR